MKFQFEHDSHRCFDEYDSYKCPRCQRSLLRRNRLVMAALMIAILVFSVLLGFIAGPKGSRIGFVVALFLDALVLRFSTRLFAIKLHLDFASRKRVAKHPPGSRLLAVARFLYSPKTVALTFESLVADLQHEYFEAIKEKKSIKSTWIRIRYFFRFLANMGLNKLWALVSGVRQVNK